MSSRRSRSGGRKISTTPRRWKRSRRNVPSSTRRRRSTLEAATTRTSTAIGTAVPSRTISPPSRTRRNFPCSSSGTESTSSRKIVPPWAASNFPAWPSRRAPVNAPAAYPNSSLSTSSRGRAPQLTATKGRSARRLSPWIACATSSLPVPLSPTTRIGFVWDPGARPRGQAQGLSKSRRGADEIGEAVPRRPAGQSSRLPSPPRASRHQPHRPSERSRSRSRDRRARWDRHGTRGSAPCLRLAKRERSSPGTTCCIACRIGAHIAGRTSPRNPEPSPPLRPQRPRRRPVGADHASALADDEERHRSAIAGPARGRRRAGARGAGGCRTTNACSMERAIDRVSANANG